MLQGLPRVPEMSEDMSFLFLLPSAWRHLSRPSRHSPHRRTCPNADDDRRARCSALKFLYARVAISRSSLKDSQGTVARHHQHTIQAGGSQTPTHRQRTSQQSRPGCPYQPLAGCRLIVHGRSVVLVPIPLEDLGQVQVHLEVVQQEHLG